MKKIISTTLFFVFFWGLERLVDWMFPFLYYLWYPIWFAIGVVSLVACKLIYDWMDNHEKGYLPPKRRAIVFFSIVFVAITILGIGYWNEYREKPMEDVLDNYSYPKELSINPTTNTSKNLKDSQLSIYDVQKTKKSNGYHMSEYYDVWWENEKGFDRKALIMLRVGINDIWVNMEHYKVLNGPVDLESIRKYLFYD
ncbi:hypothetical protein GCM10008967_28070 [Bacillus carboniphilus]|uniref:Uncharacterized protein n=1 Tax=Bacillus carboniphilus TaxID=86663 RepID=A0ABP3G8W9_9BACI